MHISVCEALLTLYREQHVCMPILNHLWNQNKFRIEIPNIRLILYFMVIEARMIKRPFDLEYRSRTFMSAQKIHAIRLTFRQLIFGMQTIQFVCQVIKRF